MAMSTNDSAAHHNPEMARSHTCVQVVAASFLAAVCAVFAIAQPTQPTTQPATLPTAQAVVDQFVEATGGREAYTSIRTRRSVGTIALADLGIEGRVTTLIRADGNAITTIELPEHGTRRRGIVDGVVWEIDFAGKAQLITGDAARSVARALSLASLTTLEGYTAAKIVDVVALNGRPSYRMLLTSELGFEEMRFYDVESSLLVKSVTRITTLGPEPIVVTTNFGNYEDVPPVRLPLRMQQMMTGMSPESTMSKVEHNVDLPDELFALPADVTKLLPATQP